jgi:hypothetical protein
MLQPRAQEAVFPIPKVASSEEVLKFFLYAKVGSPNAPIQNAQIFYKGNDSPEIWWLA